MKKVFGVLVFEIFMIVLGLSLVVGSNKNETYYKNEIVRVDTSGDNQDDEKIDNDKYQYSVKKIDWKVAGMYFAFIAGGIFVGSISYLIQKKNIDKNKAKEKEDNIQE